MSEQPNLDDLPWLHIYAQPEWHDDASIEGTRTALKNLRDAIDKALTDGRDAESKAIVADGEGYTVEIKIRSHEYLRGARLPYVADYGRKTA